MTCFVFLWCRLESQVIYLFFLYYFSHRVPRVFKATRIHGSCGPKMIFYWPLALIRWESVKPTCYTWYSVCHCKNYRISASLYSKMYKTYTKNTRHRRQEIVLFMHLKNIYIIPKFPITQEEMVIGMTKTIPTVCNKFAIRCRLVALRCW